MVCGSVMTVPMTGKLCFELGDAVIVWWQDGKLLEEANNHCNPKTADTDKGSQMRPMNLHCIFVEYWIDKPEHIDNFDKHYPHSDTGNNVEVALCVA